MKRIAVVACALVTLGLGLSSAQALSTYDRARVEPALDRNALPRLPFGPDCEEYRTRLLTCVPRVYISPDAPGVSQVIDAPPVQRRLPYPELFSW